MVAYKHELLKAEDPKDAEIVVEAAPEKEVETKELTDKEKDALVREELAQLRANVQAKKKREKKKVCVCLMHECACLYIRGLRSIPRLWAYPSSPCHICSFGMFRINPPDSRYAPISNSRLPISASLSPRDQCDGRSIWVGQS